MKKNVKNGLTAEEVGHKIYIDFFLKTEEMKKFARHVIGECGFELLSPSGSQIKKSPKEILKTIRHGLKADYACVEITRRRIRFLQGEDLPPQSGKKWANPKDIKILIGGGKERLSPTETNHKLSLLKQGD